MTTQLLAVTFVLALLGGALWWLRRAGFARLGGLALPGRRGHRLEVVESRPLGPGQAVHLIRAGDRALLLAATQAGCTLLETRPWSEMA
ncbi:MAG: flagellar biosynthetic protein FliO [Bryobacteraceae bacterium]